MTSPRDAAFNVAILDALHKLIGAELASVRKTAEPVFIDAAAEGTESLTVTLPDGTKVGKVTIKAGQDVVRVDETALLDWVRDHAATEIERVIQPSALTKPDVAAYIRRFHPDAVVERIRPAYREKLTGQINGDGELIHEPTGEIAEVAEVVKVAPTGAFILTFERAKGDKPAGRDAIAAAWRAGQLGDVLALESVSEIEQGGDQ